MFATAIVIFILSQIFISNSFARCEGILDTGCAYLLSFSLRQGRRGCWMLGGKIFFIQYQASLRGVGSTSRRPASHRGASSWAEIQLRSVSRTGLFASSTCRLETEVDYIVFVVSSFFSWSWYLSLFFPGLLSLGPFSQIFRKRGLHPFVKMCPWKAGELLSVHSVH